MTTSDKLITWGLIILTVILLVVMVINNTASSDWPERVADFYTYCESIGGTVSITGYQELSCKN
jgi:hypothetical protein